VNVTLPPASPERGNTCGASGDGHRAIVLGQADWND